MHHLIIQIYHFLLYSLDSENRNGGGGGVDDMGFNEAELLYMAAPKQMVVGGTIIVYEVVVGLLFRSASQPRTVILIWPYLTSFSTCH